jgi:hypothetical protein
MKDLQVFQPVASGGSSFVVLYHTVTVLDTGMDWKRNLPCSNWCVFRGQPARCELYQILKYLVCERIHIDFGVEGYRALAVGPESLLPAALPFLQ